MKGLLIKDLKLMKNQKMFMFLVAGICIAFIASGKEIGYVLSYASAMFSMAALSTITYDEQDNGLNFLFALPVSREKYVLEKYVFGMLMMAAIIIAGSITAVISAAAGSVSCTPQDYFIIVFGTVLASASLLSVTIPLQLKFGAEKSRIAILAALGCFLLLFYGVKCLMEAYGIDLSAAVEWAAQAGTAVIALIISVFAAVLIGISFAASVIIMKRKQF